MFYGLSQAGWVPDNISYLAQSRRSVTGVSFYHSHIQNTSVGKQSSETCSCEVYNMNLSVNNKKKSKL